MKKMPPLKQNKIPTVAEMMAMPRAARRALGKMLKMKIPSDQNVRKNLPIENKA